MAEIKCPNCGNEFDSKAKKCPSCGSKNRLTVCKVCGTQVAKNAKRCPKCGAKMPKPIYKKWWFWVIIVIMLFTIPFPSKETSTTPESVVDEPIATVTPKPTPTPTEAPPVLELVGGIEGTEGVWDGYGMHVTGKVKNNSNQNLSYVEIRFSLYDEQGNMIGSALANEFNIDANGVWSFDAIGTSWTPVDTYKCVELNYHY